MKRLRSSTYYSIIIVATLINTSCIGIYMPTAPNVPLATEKGEWEAMAGLSMNDFSLKGSYAIDEKHAIMAGTNMSFGMISRYDNMFNVLDKTENDLENEESTYKLWNSELAFGNYYALNKNKVYEIYGGLNYGHSTTELDQTTNYGSIFMQNNIGMKINKVEGAISWKLTYSYFFYNDNHLSGYTTDIVFPGLTNQASFIVKVGHENVKYWVSPGISYTNLFVSSDNNEHGFTPKDFSSRYHIAMGFCFGF